MIGFYRRKDLKKELVIVLDFGGQYNQLVARRVRECNVYCEIYSYKTDLEKIKAMNPKGIILTGGPNSCYEADSPTYSKELFELGIPVLGLCYGAQLMMHVLGGKRITVNMVRQRFLWIRLLLKSLRVYLKKQFVGCHTLTIFHR